MVLLKAASPYILLALFVSSLTAGITLLVGSGSGSPGIEILLPTATPTPELKVHVSGAVSYPGVYPLRQGDRLIEALDAAGGATAQALLSCVNLALRVTDEAHYHVPKEGESCQPAFSLVAKADEDGRINLNVATSQLLESLPGIGEVKDRAIVDYRDNNGGFKSKEELLDVQGIGSSTYEGIRELVYVGESSP